MAAVVTYFPIKGEQGEGGGRLDMHGSPRHSQSPPTPLASSRRRPPPALPPLHAGLGESIRLTLAAAGVPFENEPVPGSAGMKEDLDTYPFGQCPRCGSSSAALPLAVLVPLLVACALPTGRTPAPQHAGHPSKEPASCTQPPARPHQVDCAGRRFRDGIVDLTQSGAILRHIARTHGLYGSSPAEAAYIDQLLGAWGGAAACVGAEASAGRALGGPAAGTADTLCCPSCARLLPLAQMAWRI